MSIGVAVQTRLAAVAGITALVPATRIYPVKLKQNTAFPAISHFQVAGVRESAMGSDPGVVDGRWQIDCWGSTVASVRNVADAVRAGFKRYRGTNDGTEILDTYLEFESEVYEDETEVYHTAQSYRVWWRES